MFASTFVVALVGASAASAASVVTRTTGATFAVPSTYTQPWLEPYQDYHTRYLALKCDDKHDTKFFDACCHPMLKWETLAKARPDYCVPSASSAVASPTTHVQIVSHSASAAAVTATASASSDDEEDCDDEDDEDDEDCDDEDDNTGATSTNNNGGDDEEECEEGEEDCVCEDEPETSTAAAASSTSKATSSTKTRSTVFVTSTFTAASSSIATSSPAVTSTASSTVKTSSSTKESSSSASSTSSTKTSSSVESTTSATSTKITSTKTTQSSTSTTEKASSTPNVPLTKQTTGSYSGGFGTFYLQGGVAGACGNFHDDNALIAAIDFRRYGDLGKVSTLCGHKLKVTNDKNGKSVIVNVQDACPTCTNANSVDLSKGAFLQIATEEEGEVPISVTFV
jgi:hypothetical protein